MRTIAQLMLEDIGSASPHSRDVALILGEIDRLSQTTTRLGLFAASFGPLRCCLPDRVLARLLSILEHLARERCVTLEISLSPGEGYIAGSEASLSEIFFNLIKNAIEAASSLGNGQGTVVVQTQVSSESYLCTVSDNGPGIAPEIQATMLNLL